MIKSHAGDKSEIKMSAAIKFAEAMHLMIPWIDWCVFTAGQTPPRNSNSLARLIIHQKKGGSGFIRKIQL